MLPVPYLLKEDKMSVTASRDDEEVKSTKEKPKDERIAIGSPVTLVKASLGWGGSKEGDFGIVTSRDTAGRYYIYIPRTEATWQGYKTDIKLLDVNETEYTPLWNKFNLGVKEEEIHKTMASLWRLGRMSQAAKEEAKDKICIKINALQQEVASLYEALEWYNSASFTPPMDSPSNLSAYLLSANMVCYLLQDRYSEIRMLDDNRIRAVTKPIKVTYKYKNINLGRYVVVIYGNSVRFERVDAEVNPSLTQGYLHPHIKSTGEACWGNFWSNEVTGLINNRNYLSLLNKLYDFLSSYHQEGWYHSVMFWHPDANKLCRKCWENPCVCQERICVHCEKVIDKSCKCVRCPESNEIIGKDYDEYCRISCEIWDKEKKICKSAQ